jgi:hypothetical protein
MSREELWRKFAERNPSFDGDGMVTLSARGLRKLFRQTWDFAYEAGASDGTEGNADGTEAVPPSSVGDDSMVEGLMRRFGMKK